MDENSIDESNTEEKVTEVSSPKVEEKESK